MGIEPIIAKRILLRPVDQQDAPFILELLNSPGWLEYIGDRQVRSEVDAKHYIKQHFINSYRLNGHGLMVVTAEKSGEAIGLCGLLQRDYLDAPDLGFAILPSFEGRGYMYEASRAVLQYGFENLKLDRIYATAKRSNKRSRHLLKKLGFRHQKAHSASIPGRDTIIFKLCP